MIVFKEFMRIKKRKVKHYSMLLLLGFIPLFIYVYIE